MSNQSGNTNPSNTNLFGAAKFGGEFVKRKWFKLKDGESTFRILPPMGDLAAEGRWSVFYNIHYGYKNSKGEMRTFQSPLVKNRKTKMIEVPDPALDRINQLKAELEKAKAEGNKELADKLLKLVGGSKSRFNLDSNHYLNVIDEQGNIGILKIRHRAMLALQATIKGLRDKQIEPLSPENGRFFTFRRSGNALETVYQVEVKKKQLHVEGLGTVEQDIVHSITDDIAARCLTRNKDGSFLYKEAARLDSLFKKPTAEEVARIVKEGEKAVDEILDKKNEATAAAQATGQTYQETDADIEDEYGTTGTPAAQTQASAPASAPTTPATQATAAPAPAAATPPAAQAATSQVAQTMAAPQAPKVTPLSDTKTSAQSIAQQSDEEFLKSMGL